MSTEDQRLYLQRDALAAAGCHRTFEDHASGARVDRPGLAAAIFHLRRGNTLVVGRLDRLGRTTHQLVNLLERFEREGIRFRPLQDGTDPASVMGKAMLQIGAVFAEMERNLDVVQKCHFQGTAGIDRAVIAEGCLVSGALF